MSTEPQRPASRITEALLPPGPPAPRGPSTPPRPPAPPGPPAPEPPKRPAPSATSGPRVPPPAPSDGPGRTGPGAADGTPPGTGARSTGRPLPPERPAGGAERPTETTTRLRPIRDTRTAPAPPAPPYTYDAWATAAEPPAETTTRLRPVPGRSTGRVALAAACAVLAVGLVGGAAAGALLAGAGAGEPDEPPGYTPARTLWRNAPVDTLFPRALPGPAAGPGGATRTWTRIVVAPDAPCTAATLPPKLYAALSPLGCDRVLRATYTDATSSQVTTVALAFTRADPATMRTLGSRAADEPPPALAGPGTVADGFGGHQRASWWRHILPDLPVVVTAVSGFADGRAVAAPEPADRAMTPKRTTAIAQAGLGHEAKGVAEAVERALRRTVAATVEEDQR